MTGRRPTRFDSYGLSSTQENYEIEIEKMVDVNNEPFWMYYVYENGSRYLIGGADTFREAMNRAQESLLLLYDQEQDDDSSAN